MPRPPAWLIVWLLALVVGLGGTVWRPWQSLELRLFDQWSRLSASRGSVLPITIVGVDEASFAQIGQRWPWPRDLHARLIDRLTEAGAAVIAFDMIFAENASPGEDAAMAAAIRRAGNVVLAADHVYQETAGLRQWLRVDPLPELQSAGARSGLTSVVIDGDAVIRRFPDSPDIFWRQTIAALQAARPELGLAGDIPAGALVRHLGPAHTFPYVSYHRVLAESEQLPPELFRDQIVLVGRDVRASPEVGNAQADLFATPFLDTSQLLTPGVEIHATLIENALTGSAIAPASLTQTMGMLSLFAVLALPALRRWHPAGSGLWLGALAAVALGLSWWLFEHHSFWMAPGATASTLVMMYVGNGLLAYLAERERAAQIKGAFAKYVAPQVVEQMVARPELVRLGGERRELTLLFCDLAGFTSMSERLTPEAVARVINRYLTAMTRIIISRGGTVDKFIGDAVMAFWGAPLTDAQHARHAVEAAVAMQQAMDDLQAEFAAMGAGIVSLRIGIHSGPAVVGNMGSEERFDYTALGDTVNLASRLEGINKIYGTRILLSSSTAEALGPDIRVRTVDRVRVKGKNEAVEVMTPCENISLIEATEQAIRAYRAADWARARQLWLQIAEHYPGDVLAAVFLPRIDELECNPPIDWDGSVALEKA